MDLAEKFLTSTNTLLTQAAKALPNVGITARTGQPLRFYGDGYVLTISAKASVEAYSPGRWSVFINPANYALELEGPDTRISDPNILGTAFHYRKEAQLAGSVTATPSWGLEVNRTGQSIVAEPAATIHIPLGPVTVGVTTNFGDLTAELTAQATAAIPIPNSTKTIQISYEITATIKPAPRVPAPSRTPETNPRPAPGAAPTRVAPFSPPSTAPSSHGSSPPIADAPVGQLLTVFGENVTTIFKPTGTGRILEQIGQGLPRAADDFKNFLESVASQTAAHNHTLYGNPIWNYFDPAA